MVLVVLGVVTRYSKIQPNTLRFSGILVSFWLDRSPYTQILRRNSDRLVTAWRFDAKHALTGNKEF
jgi:hypothetical protein